MKEKKKAMVDKNIRYKENLRKQRKSKRCALNVKFAIT